MAPEEPHDEPSEVTAEDGVVIVDGPDGVAVTLTPGAAVETSHRLLDGGLEAQGQRVQQERAVAARRDGDAQPDAEL